MEKKHNKHYSGRQKNKTKILSTGNNPLFKEKIKMKQNKKKKKFVLSHNLKQSILQKKISTFT